MRVLFVPRRLRAATLLLFASVPLAAFQFVLASRVPWWKLAYRSVGIWCAAALLICTPLALWISGGKSWAIRVTLAIGIAWSLLSAGLAIHTGQPALGFFTIFLLLFFLGELSWLRLETGRSFFDPGLKWYEALPRPIPELKCQLLWEGEKVEFRVSRLDGEGAFLIARTSGDSPRILIDALADAPKAQIKDLWFQFRNRQVQCAGVPVCWLDRGEGIGLGLQFRGQTPDTQKELGDFVENLRGEGYV